MASTRVCDAALRAYLNVGHSQADAVRHFGVSEASIHQRISPEVAQRIVSQLNKQ